MTVEVFSAIACALGEGPIWHPGRETLFWFDILSKRLHGKDDVNIYRWDFDEQVSAAGWVDRDTLLMAGETGLYRFELTTGARELVVSIEADQPETRSNDGRADPWGGFWIGTMGKSSQPGAGSIYRFWRGEVRRLVGGVTISNSICFSPDRSCAFYTDTTVNRIMRQPLDAETGWPSGNAKIHVDLAGESFGADGSVVDSEGCLWNAQWGAARVARYGADGAQLSQVDLPTPHVTCPAFGGVDLKTLYVTSAAGEISDEPAGQTFAICTGIVGQREHQIIL